jgi:hypothetical protein
MASLQEMCGREAINGSFNGIFATASCGSSLPSGDRSFLNRWGDF